MCGASGTVWDRQNFDATNVSVFAPFDELLLKGATRRGLKFYTQTQNVRDIIHYTRIAQIAPFEVFKHSNFMRLSSTKTKTVGVV